jgi:hypothetical protein
MLKKVRNGATQNHKIKNMASLGILLAATIFFPALSIVI